MPAGGNGVAGEPYDLSPAQAAPLLPINFAAFLVNNMGRMIA